jgi:hypothetical protein
MQSQVKYLTRPTLEDERGGGGFAPTYKTSRIPNGGKTSLQEEHGERLATIVQRLTGAGEIRDTGPNFPIAQVLQEDA